MPVSIQCERFPLTKDEVDVLWTHIRAVENYPDDEVCIRCVSERDILRFNKQYRGVKNPTNVLTFSYDGEHDVALCLDVARREARGRKVNIRDYVALLVTHALLHATGMDHEQSEREAVRMRQVEKDILEKARFNCDAL